MASITLQVGAEYATGTTLSVYNTTNSVPTTPVGSVVTTAVVGGDGNVTFTGLTTGLNYFAYAASGAPQYVRFYVPTPTPTAGGGSGVILPWATGTDYTAGQPVTSGGQTYTAIDNHTAGATFAGDQAAHWVLFAGLVQTWAASTAVKAGQLIRFGTLLYLVTADHTTPSVFSTTNLSQIGTTSGVSTTNSDLLPIGYSNGSFSTAKGFSGGTDTDANTRLKHVAVRAVTAPRLVYDNMQGSDPITVSAGFELASGTIKRVTFNGANSVAIPVGSFVVSDPVGAYIASGATCWSRTRIVVSSGGHWMSNRVPDQSGEGSEQGTGTTDKTMSGTISGFIDGVYGPLLVVAKAPSGKPFVLGYGDSILQGTGDKVDGPVTAGGTSLDAGFVHRACASNLFPWSNGGQTAESAATAGELVSPNAQVTARRVISVYAGVVYCEHGINDILGASTAAQVEQFLVNCWTANGAGGARVIQATLTPYSTSTDSWTTLAGQTPIANDAKRIAINDWIRAGAPLNASTFAPVAVGTSGALLAGQPTHPLHGYDDTADAVESARNSGKWGGVVSDTGTTVSGNATINGVNGALWEVGMNITSASTPFAGTYIVSKTSTSITVNSNAAVNASGSGVALHGAITGDGLHPNGAGHARMAAVVNTAQWTA